MKALLLLLVCASTAAAQAKSAPGGRPQYVAVPRELVMMLVADQPDSPLRIEEATYLLRVDRPGVIQRYRVRNVSNKPVKFFSVVSWDLGGGGGTLPLDFAASGRVLQPGETFDTAGDGAAYEVVPLTDKLREELKRDRGLRFEGEMKSAFILMVDQVYFTDDTTYKDQRASKALREYLSKLAESN